MQLSSEDTIIVWIESVKKALFSKCPMDICPHLKFHAPLNYTKEGVIPQVLLKALSGSSVQWQERLGLLGIGQTNGRSGTKQMLNQLRSLQEMRAQQSSNQMHDFSVGQPRFP
jgi:hypothetical protein